METPESHIDCYYNNAGDCLLRFPTDDDTLFINDDSSNFNSSSLGTLSYQFVAADSHFSGDLCVPYDKLREVEWASNFVDSSSPLQSTLHIIMSGAKPLPPPQSTSYPESVIMFQPHDQSNRSRADLDSTILRKCLHCAAEKTPQWRTGPMGPKTLCNACGVRYKSGRLVPEYRPAASPTFVATRHSNSHRKVLELRRHKEMHRVQHQQEQFLNQTSIFGVSNFGHEDFMIHHHNGVPNPNFRKII